MKLLITGGAGFAGSSLGLAVKDAYPGYEVIAMDNLRRRGSELNLKRLRAHGITFVHGDVRNKEDFMALPRVDVVIDASAEPSVLAGVADGPEYVIHANLGGTVNCLSYAAAHGAAFIFLSTSRVYPIAQVNALRHTETATRFSLDDAQELPGASGRGIAEEFPLDGHRSFYGTTKLCSEMLIQEYAAFNGLRAVVNRCGVLTGPWQMGRADQGVVVLWMARHYWRRGLAYHGFGGTGKQVRDVLHIRDMWRLVDYEMHHMDAVAGTTFNVGGGTGNSVSLCELTELCAACTGNRIPVGASPETRSTDVRIYVTDNRKVTKATGWAPSTRLPEIIADIGRWIGEHSRELDEVLQ